MKKNNFELYLEKIQQQILDTVSIPKELIENHPHQKDIEESFQKMHEQDRSKTSKTNLT